MGGSAIGGDLAAAAIGGRARRPLTTVRGYSLPPWAGGDALVLCASYSGNTEETLACFDDAGVRGAPRVALTTGGALAERAREAGVPVIGVPSGMQPRAAVAYMTVGALECAALAGAAPSLRDEVEAAAEPLTALAAEWAPDGAADALPKRLAAALRGTLPVIHGAGLTAPAARRWKTQLNENAEIVAAFADLPEASHNEIVGWRRGPEGAPPAAAVFLEDEDQHERVRRRIDLLAGVTEAAGAPTERVAPFAGSRVERLLALVLLGDLVSVYLAVLDGVDPTPVDAIERFKRALG
jgi:glucose/mannose-6-phosphate isomerase